MSSAHRFCDARELTGLDSSPDRLKQYAIVGSETEAPSPTAVRLPVDIRRLPWTSRITADYAYEYGNVAPFFMDDPTREVAWHDAMRRVHERARPREAVADVLMRQQRRRDAPPAARAAAAGLVDARALAVVTGQQAGLFGGPLYTLLKALTALKLADHTSSRLGVPVVPIFWIDAEDHDWAEVRACGVLDGDLQSRRLELPGKLGADGGPVSAIVLDDSIEAALEALGATLAPGPFTATLLSELRAAYRPGVGMADAFARWMELLLGAKGLVVFDSSDPDAKPLVASVFTRELETAGRTSELTREAGDRLAKLGYQPQLTLQPDSPALFHLDGARRSIRGSGDDLRVGDTRRTRAALIDEAATHPTRFSPNVALRPIVQDTLFPTVAYVAGPNELNYLAQLRGVYEHFGVPMPLMFPRATASLVDSAATRFLTRYDVPLETLHARDEATLNRLLESQLPPSVDAAIEQARGAARESLGAVIAAVPALDPTLEGAARSTLERMERDIQTLHGKVIQAAKRKNETLRRQFARTQTQIFPEGHLQERALGTVFFLNRYGPALVDRLSEVLALELGVHWVVTL